MAAATRQHFGRSRCSLLLILLALGCFLASDPNDIDLAKGVSGARFVSIDQRLRSKHNNAIQPNAHVSQTWFSGLRFEARQSSHLLPICTPRDATTRLCSLNL